MLQEPTQCTVRALYHYNSPHRPSFDKPQILDEHRIAKHTTSYTMTIYIPTQDKVDVVHNPGVDLHLIPASPPRAMPSMAINKSQY